MAAKNSSGGTSQQQEEPDTLPPINWARERINVVLTGSTGGIGSAMLNLLLAADDRIERVYTLDRPSEGRKLEPRSKRHQALELDFADNDAYGKAAEQIAESATRVDLLINCIGLLHNGDVQPEKSLRSISLEQMQTVFSANAYPVVMLASAFEKLLRHKGNSVFASISAKVGSIQDNGTGGWYSYRASKAAHNMLLKTLSIEWAVKLPHCICVSLHPGTVATGLSKPFVSDNYRNKVHSPEAAANNLLKQIGELDQDDSGSFVAWNGKRLPW